MGYRQTYEKFCQTKIPKGYEIHHIDLDRNNNNIMNLVMLPKELHVKYHSRLEKLKYTHYEIETKLQSTIEMGYMINDYILKVDLELAKEFITIWYECTMYVDYRNYLLGIIPIDLHNMEEKIYGNNKSE